MKRLTTVQLVFIFILSSFTFGADFISDRQKDGFLKALQKRDSSYDPQEFMIKRPFSSPGYHTTLKGGFVHPTRDSLDYAVALFDSGQKDRIERGKQIISKVISLQDQDPANRTYGIWSWFYEEPLDKMSPPDWNWADFCGTQLLQIAIDHWDKLDKDLQKQVRDSIIHACYAIKKRNVGPGYTNIAIMGAYVTISAGQLFENDEIFQYGKARLQRFYDYTMEKGSFSEYNSPTYSIVAISEISRMLLHVKDPQCRQIIEKLNDFAWYHVARHFHVPTTQWAGPHSRCYATMLRSSSLRYIQAASGGKLHFVDESSVWDSLNIHRIRPQIPDGLIKYFKELPGERLEIEFFKKEGSRYHDLVGTTWLGKDFTIGTVNVGDMWNQRRSLLAYFKTPGSSASLRLRCLHDGYDYSSATVFNVQDKADILTAVVFATDRGDTHISLDRINGKIKAGNLSLAFEAEGDVKSVTMPDDIQVGKPFTISVGNSKADICFVHAQFGHNGMSTAIKNDSKSKSAQLVLYAGDQKVIDFENMDEAVVIIACSIRTEDQNSDMSGLKISRNNDRITAVWSRSTGNDMELTVPVKPMKTGDQKLNSSAKLDNINPWKAE